ncbi:MAG: metal ABC transporter permease, partial [Solirubrobacteraceae bacterium]
GGFGAAGETRFGGAVLWLGWWAAWAGFASRLSANPYRALALSAALAVASVWVGVAISYEIAALPPSSAIVAVAAAFYAIAVLATREARIV